MITKYIIPIILCIMLTLMASCTPNGIENSGHDTTLSQESISSTHTIRTEMPDNVTTSVKSEQIYPEGLTTSSLQIGDTITFPDFTAGVESSIVIHPTLRKVTAGGTTFYIEYSTSTPYDLLVITGIESDHEHVTIPYELVAENETRYGIIRDIFPTRLSLPHTKTLTFSEGIQWIDLSNITSGYSIEEIYFPSSLTALIGHQYDYQVMTRTAHTRTMPDNFTNLKQIHVALGNPIYQDHDGVLYAQDSLVCIPQDYRTKEGTVTIRDGTIEMRYHSVYQCRNIERLIIPDSVQTIHVEAIVATAKKPLTIVCSRNSAASQYVNSVFSEHLTVEYTD